MRPEDIEYGPVRVTAGKHKGRIAYLDDDDIGESSGDVGFVYFGTFLLHYRSAVIPIRQLEHITTDALLSRMGQIESLIAAHAKEPLSERRRLDLLHEYHYIICCLTERWENARHKSKGNRGLRVFISHSSKNHDFAKWISVDLADLGHRPWLDEWEIRAGESIPRKIAEGLDRCDVVIVVLSPEAVASGWVEREWQAKYWDEVERNQILVIPALHKQCSIPTLLRTKKYADFTNDFRVGMNELAQALAKRRRS